MIKTEWGHSLTRQTFIDALELQGKAFLREACVPAGAETDTWRPAGWRHATHAEGGEAGREGGPRGPGAASVLRGGDGHSSEKPTWERRPEVPRAEKDSERASH